MRIKLWGVRGSLPAPMSPETFQQHLAHVAEAFAEARAQSLDPKTVLASLPRHRAQIYGGNTPCVEVSTGEHQVIIDGGSGIRRLGYEMLKGAAGKGGAHIHLVFTHFHWDHLIGLPFFVPLFLPGNVIHVYSPESALRDVFTTLFRKPFFPVPLESLPSKIEYHQIEGRKPTVIGDLAFTPYRLDHPDPCWGYKFEHEGKCFSHCVDTECLRVSREQLGPDLPLYQNLDLMTFDAQYTLMETLEKVNWGHASAFLGLELAMREGIKRVLFMHHDPASSDEKIARVEAQARHYYQSQLKFARDAGQAVQEVEWEFAREEMSVLL